MKSRFLHHFQGGSLVEFWLHEDLAEVVGQDQELRGKMTTKLWRLHFQDQHHFIPKGGGLWEINCLRIAYALYRIYKYS